jgi:isopentenyl phosphate kinase
MPEIRELLGGSAHVDVTGGMLGKVEELCRLAEKGVPASIFNATKAGNVKRFLENQSPGTCIHGDK